MMQRGDTIVEVLFAVTVFSLIAVGGLSIMNQGAAMAQRSLEIGQVRDQMDSQADALRFLHSAYLSNLSTAGASTTKKWQDVVKTHAVTKAQPFADDADQTSCHLPNPANASSSASRGEPFALDVTKLDPDSATPVLSLSQGDTIDKTETFAQIRYPAAGSTDPARSEGLWIQAVYSPPSGRVLGYYDFHIRACWLTPGQAAPLTLGTIVRLYEP